MQEVTVKFTHDQIDDITRRNLIQVYNLCRQDVERLQDRKKREGHSFPTFLNEDLKDNKRAMKAYRKIIKWMSTKSDLKEFDLDFNCEW